MPSRYTQRPSSRGKPTRYPYLRRSHLKAWISPAAPIRSSIFLLWRFGARVRLPLARGDPDAGLSSFFRDQGHLRIEALKGREVLVRDLPGDVIKERREICLGVVEFRPADTDQAFAAGGVLLPLVLERFSSLIRFGPDPQSPYKPAASGSTAMRCLKKARTRSHVHKVKKLLAQQTATKEDHAFSFRSGSGYPPRKRDQKKT